MIILLFLPFAIEGPHLVQQSCGNMCICHTFNVIIPPHGFLHGRIRRNEGRRVLVFFFSRKTPFLINFIFLMKRVKSSRGDYRLFPAPRHGVDAQGWTDRRVMVGIRAVMKPLPLAFLFLSSSPRPVSWRAVGLTATTERYLIKRDEQVTVPPFTFWLQLRTDLLIHRSGDWIAFLLIWPALDASFGIWLHFHISE